MIDSNVPQKPDNADELEKQSVDGLVHSLHNSTDPNVRQYAAYLLGKTKNPRAIQPLVEALGDFDKSVREQSMLADEKAIKPLIQALKDNRDHVRYMATKGLREIGDSDAVDPMIILLEDENRYVRMMAARALSAIGGKKVHDALRNALKAETDDKVKEAITEAMQ